MQRKKQEGSSQLGSALAPTCDGSLSSCGGVLFWEAVPPSGADPLLCCWPFPAVLSEGFGDDVDRGSSNASPRRRRAWAATSTHATAARAAQAPIAMSTHTQAASPPPLSSEARELPPPVSGSDVMSAGSTLQLSMTSEITIRLCATAAAEAPGMFQLSIGAFATACPPWILPC